MKIPKIVMLLLISLMSLVFKNSPAQNHQHNLNTDKTGQHEIFSASTERTDVVLLTNVSSLTAGKKLVFTVRAGVKDSNFRIQPNSIFMNIYNMSTSENETRLVFVNTEKKGEYSTGYTFAKAGKYKFSLIMDVVNDSNNVKTEEVSFSKEVVKNKTMQAEESGSGFMGMGTAMMIVAGAVMMVIMALVVMNGHR